MRNVSEDRSQSLSSSDKSRGSSKSRSEDKDSDFANKKDLGRKVSDSMESE
jgi:hypothetical protein